MGDLKSIFEGVVLGNEKEEPRRTSRVLVVFAHGRGLVLLCGKGVVLDYIHEGFISSSAEGFSLDEVAVDYEPLPDGVYIGLLKLVDDGPGDYPGTREVVPELSNARLATADEWKAHLAGAWPWDETEGAA